MVSMVFVKAGLAFRLAVKVLFTKAQRFELLYISEIIHSLSVE
jgi:hypothetical protein